MEIREIPDRARLTTLTGNGRGAIGVIAVWGPSAVSVADAAFRPVRGPSLAESPSGRLRLGRVGQGLGDEVVAMVLDGSPPSVEIQCHGGPAALVLVMQALQEAGAEPAEPACWAEHQAGSPIRAQALVDLASATTLRVASILLDQSHGALDRELAELFSEIGSEPEIPTLGRLRRLISRGRLGAQLTSGWRVVIRGRPNVGKSLLLNALAGYQRAIVDATPGTTRDAVTADVAFDGWPIRLVDTAGVRATSDELERSGIERTHREVGNADLVLQVLDRSRPLNDDDLAWLAAPGSTPTIVVANKSDLPPGWELTGSALGGLPTVIVSARQGEGIDRLIAAVVDRLVPEPPEPGAGIPFRADHLDALEEAVAALERRHVADAVAAITAILHPRDAGAGSR